MVEPGGSLHDAARRELAEETGHVALDIGDVLASTREQYEWWPVSRMETSVEEFFPADLPRVVGSLTSA
jgi:8-oxo-dGTP pyrophosphatase MutT (NUDIX family)